MKKKATEYVIGDRFFEYDRDAGTVFSLAIDERCLNRAYILVRSDVGIFTIFSCFRDAVCEPYVARNIPRQVLTQFLFDVYFDGNEPCVQKNVQRVPVLQPQIKSPAESLTPKLDEDSPKSRALSKISPEFIFP
jgi:hypothetical protein